MTVVLYINLRVVLIPHLCVDLLWIFGIPLCFPYSREGQSSGQLPFQRKIPAFRMKSASLSELLSSSLSSSGERPFHLSFKLPISQVLLPLQGSSILESQRYVLLLVRSASFCISWGLDDSKVLEKIIQDEAEIALIVPYWPQRPWFPKLLSLYVGLLRGLPCQSDLIKQPPLCLLI